MFILLLPNVFYADTTPIRCLRLKLFSMATQLVIKEQRHSGLLQRLCTVWWIDFFADVAESGECDLALNIHRECLKFSFSQIIQTQLDIVKESCKSHLIRRTFTTDPSVTPHGRPDVLYFALELSRSDAVDHRKTFDW